MVITYYKGHVMSVSDNLKKARKHRGYTQEEMAVFLNKSVAAYKKYENGGVIPPTDVIKKIANTLGTTTDQLIFDKDEITPSDEKEEVINAINRMSKEDFETIKKIVLTINLYQNSKKIFE